LLTPISTLFLYTTLFRSSIVRNEKETPARVAQRSEERKLGGDDPGVVPAHRREQGDRVRHSGVVGHDEERSLRRDTLATPDLQGDRKSTRLNSSHVAISY